MNFQALLTKSFWFTIDPAVLHKVDYAFLILGAVFIVASILSFILKLRIKNSYDKNLFKKVSSAFAIVGLLEVVWFGLRYEHIAFFGTHFFAGLIILVLLIYIAFVFKDVFKNRTALVEKCEKEQINLKYLPKQR
jgi:predicted CDP-diglyceride synthetase/phosphatidate cytidylyltransferase